MNQIRFNAHEHRSSRGKAPLFLPDGMKLLPQIMNENGYSTFNLGKTDYNFVLPNSEIFTFDQKQRAPIPWDKIKASQPFYGQIQTAGGKQNTRNWPAERKTDRDSVIVPADYPDTPAQREVVAEHYDSIRKDDDFIGEILNGLKESGLWENTIVVYFGDHGANQLVRHKQMPTEGGLHVPFVVYGPEKYVPRKEIRNDLVDMLDLSATTLAWAGIPIPGNWEGQNLFSKAFQAREFVAAAKDRLDHTIDRVRTIRTDRYRLTRNYKTDRIFLQPQYRDGQPYMEDFHKRYHAGKLSDRHAEIYFGERPFEEFYDVENDPAQMFNLIDDPKLAGEVQRHRQLLDAWIAKGDAGEGEENLQELLEQSTSRWVAVNPEYEAVRTDHDGDGLSSEWEEGLGRDPKDGKLQFLFDNGGWQTEGWHGVGNVPNIAGYLGYLDFDLPDGEGSIVRTGLNAEAAKNNGQLEIKAKVSAPVLAWLSAENGSGEIHQIAGPITLKEAKKFKSYGIDLSGNPHWKGNIQSLKLTFQGEPGVFIEIDSMVVN